MSVPKKKTKTNSFDGILSDITKEFGQGSIMMLGDSSHPKVEVIPTGNIVIDRALGVGGLPKGRIVEIFGPESSGKTTLALTVIANCQRAGGRTAFIDVEHALDRPYAIKLGIDENNLLISQPDSGEEALRMVERLVRSKEIDMIVVDSVAALTTRAEIEGEIGDALVGQHARMMSAALRKLTAPVSEHNVLLLFTNQIRNTIGNPYGPNETTPGGKAMKFYAAIRIEIKRISHIKSGENQIYGGRTRIKVVKNKVAPPFKEAEFDIIHGEGICNMGSLIDEAIDKGILEKKGSWLSFQGSNIAQGREGAKEALKGMDQLRLSIEKLVAES